jgi:hypothetical protein
MSLVLRDSQISARQPGTNYWKRFQRHVQHLHVIISGVAGRIPRAQQPGQRVPTGYLGPVGECQQGWKPKVFFQVAAAAPSIPV